MKVELSDRFLKKLANQVSYIALDKPEAARKFKNNLLQEVKKLNSSPFRFRKSTYFDDENIRQFSFKGYTILFLVEENRVLVFSLIKHQQQP